MNKKKTYKLQLPKDVDVDKAHLRIHDGQIVVDVEFKDKFIPKFGDIVKCIYSDTFGHSRNYMICICGKRNNIDYSRFNIANVNLSGLVSFQVGEIDLVSIQPASESEKKELFDKLAEVGKKWNTETKQLEDIRWSPEEGEKFYFVAVNGSVDSDNFLKRYMDFIEEYPNCFKTENAAQKVADKFKELLKQSKAE